MLFLFYGFLQLKTLDFTVFYFTCLLYFSFTESGGVICISRLFVFSVHVNLLTLLRDFVVKVMTFLFIRF